MNCDKARGELMRTDRADLKVEVAAHLDECESCAAFLHNFELAEASLRDHRSEHLPDARFAQRVSAAVANETDQLGWAAARLLPAALALTLVLTAWAWLATPSPSMLVEQSPTDDLLSWVLQENGS